jgi:hypothetical protein
MRQTSEMPETTEFLYQKRLKGVNLITSGANAATTLSQPYSAVP